MRTVRDAMLHHPTVHAADLTVGQARAAFVASPKTHLLLLVRDGRLLATVTHDDLESADAAALAISVGTLAGRTLAPDDDLPPVQDGMTRIGQRRLAVVDADGRLLGLLCLKASLTGFCTDEGVAAMRRERAARGAAS